MLQALRWVVWALGRLVIALRYRIRLHGDERLRDLHGPVLILPNHPALLDPVMVLFVLWPRLHPRPMLYEGNFENPVLWPLMVLLNALRVPDLTQASAKARVRAQRALDDAIASLQRGENVILWPSGRIQRGGVEVLGGARAAADILAAVPQAQLVLVRTRGMWGSMFSFAPTRTYPPLLRNMGLGAELLLANLLLFMPRRRVDVTVEPIDRQRLPELKRETLNPWLETWYNADTGGAIETPTYVPYHFLFGPRTFDYPSGPPQTGGDLGKVRPETRVAVSQLVERKLHRPLTETEQQPETTLDQLGLDSLDRMEVALDVEQHFGFASEQVPLTLGDLWLLGEGLAEKGQAVAPPRAWFRPVGDELLAIRGETIPEAFVDQALRHPGEVAEADDLAGALTYGRALAGALVLARRFARLPGANVGLLMPASVGCDVAFLGLQLAGKLPVLLNWTTGPANLAHAARLMGLTHVVTSNRFIDRLGGLTVEGTENVCLEDLRKQTGWLEPVRTLLTVRLFPGRIRRQVPRLNPDQPAVVLFTSGSERAPKAVPLTHRNLLTVQQASITALEVRRSDSLLGFLPAFHSFGISVTSLLPLLGGMRVVHHPDPTAAGALARKVGSYRPTILVGTPTFVSYILERAGPGQLTSLRMIVVGAEKAPESLRQRCAQAAPAAVVLEGYGITECSPVVSVNRSKANKPGTVGQPLPGVEVCVVDLESEQVLPPGRMGMLQVSGPTVFPGYLGQEDGSSPFRERDGKRWYVTGDLGEIDAEGFIRLSGRLKRFLKAGGEMISLPALEEPFIRLHPPVEEGPRVAVEGVETEHGRRIVLFTTEPMTLQEANGLLQKEGFRGVMRLDEVWPVNTIPVLGTGKTDYKALRALLTNGEHPTPGRAG